MATNFPGALDTFANPTASTPLNSASIPHHTQHANENDAILALEAKVGINGSVVATSLDFLVAQLASGKQPVDATLAAFAALTIAANSLTVGTGADAFTQTTFAANTFPARASTGNLVAKTLSDFALTFLDDADGAAVRTTIGAGTSSFSGAFSALSGIPTTLAGYGITDAQGLDATLTALAGLTIAADSLSIGTGADAFTQVTFAANTFPAKSSSGALVAKTITDFALTFLDDTNGAAVRATIGAGTSSFSGAFADLTGKPTTLSGYGITDGATQSYVDLAVGNLVDKMDCQCATVAVLAAYTYANGSSGVGATITLTVAAVLVLDGYTPALNDRILVKNETGANRPYNGIYKLTTVGVLGVTQAVLTRTLDFDQSEDGLDGAHVFVQNGTVNANTEWYCSTNAAITFGTTNISFSQFTGTTYTGDEVTVHLSGTTFAVISTYVGQTSITTLGTITTGTWQGTIIDTARGGTGVNNSTGGTANTFWARPDGGTGAATYRAIVAADIPTLNQNTTGSAAKLTTARTINGVSFDGTANITVTAAGSTLTGSALASGLIGTAGTQACAGNDSRLSDSRAPTAHASTHLGGSDPTTLINYVVRELVVEDEPLVLDSGIVLVVGSDNTALVWCDSGAQDVRSPVTYIQFQVIVKDEPFVIMPNELCIVGDSSGRSSIWCDSGQLWDRVGERFSTVTELNADNLFAIATGDVWEVPANSPLIRHSDPSLVDSAVLWIQ